MKQSYVFAVGLAMSIANASATPAKVEILAPAQITHDVKVSRVNTPFTFSEECSVLPVIADQNLVMVKMDGSEFNNERLTTRADGDIIPEGFQMGLEPNSHEAYVMKCTSTATEVTIPDNITVSGEVWPVTVIYKQSFSALSTMTTINFGKNIRLVDTQAFVACMKLTTVNMNEGLIEIGDQAFSTFCTGIKSITLPSTVETLGERCFSGTSIAGEFIINKNLKTIGGGAFAGKKITGFYICEEGNANFQSIEGALFTKDGESLVVYPPALIEATMNLPQIKKLSPYAFAYCTTLKSIALPNATSIGDYAFSGCSQLESFEIAKSVKEIGIGVFKDNKKLNNITIEAGNTAFKSYNGLIVSEATKQLLAIPYNTTELNIPDGVKSICDNIAYNNANITSLNAPASMQEIGTYAFYGCSSLVNISLSGVINIGNYAFYGLKKAEKLSLPSTVRTVGQAAFAQSIIKEVTFQDGVETIGASCFLGSSIEKCNIPGTVKELGSSIFYQCVSLSELKLGEGLKYLPEAFCYGCEKLYFLDFPKTLTEIGKSAFSFSWLQIADLPEGLTKIGNSAFQLAPLHYIEIPNSVVEIGDLGFSITNAEYIKCGKGLKKIGSNCFQSSKKAKTIELNEGIEVLGMRALYGEEAVSEIVLPASVTEIGDSLLLNTKLPKLINMSEKPQVLKSAITGYYDPFPSVTPIYDSMILVVPHGCKEVYQKAEIWGLYKNIQELPASSVVGIETTEANEIIAIYDLTGVKRDCLQEGINICIMSDGTVIKKLYRK